MDVLNFVILSVNFISKTYYSHRYRRYTAELFSLTTYVQILCMKNRDDTYSIRYLHRRSSAKEYNLCSQK